jgi:putative addiction module component (TIGR02574 family)
MIGEYNCLERRNRKGMPMKTKDLIAEAISLPIEERARIVDSLLKSLNSPEEAIDQKWAATAKERLKEIRSGKVETIPGDEVFAKILKS